MNNNKTQFIVDNYVDVKRTSELTLVTKLLSAKHVLFVVEPWPDNRWRVYVRKDAAEILRIIEEDTVT